MFGNVPQLTSSLSDSWKFLCQATKFTDFSVFETSLDTFRTMCTSEQNIYNKGFVMF